MERHDVTDSLQTLIGDSRHLLHKIQIKGNLLTFLKTDWRATLTRQVIANDWREMEALA